MGERMWIVGGGGIGVATMNAARMEGYYVELTGKSVDVTYEDEVEDFVYRHFRKNPAAAIVYTAGVNELAWIKDSTPGQFRHHMEVNVGGFVNVLMALQRQNHPPCRVVAVSSDAARRPMRASLAYCASKAALDMAVKVAARELGPDGWRINAVSPGMTAPTGMSESMDQQIPAVRGWTPEEALEYEMAQAVIKRRAMPQEIATVIMHTLQGPDYLNGSIIEVNGGR